MSDTTTEHGSVVPVPELADCLEQLVGYRMSGFRPGVHAGLPSTTLTFIISFDQPVDMVAMPGPSQSPGAYWTVLSGLHSSPAGIAHDGAQHGIQLDLSPMGARRLFGLPASALASTVVDLDSVIGRERTEALRSRLASSPGWSDRFAVLQDALVGLRRARADETAVAIRPELQWAWAQLRGATSGVSVGALADELGWSRRHLSAQFRAEFGLTPREAARIARFERARRRLQLPQRTSLATVAAESGYADQAHFTREWSRLAGSTPTAWLRDEDFPSVQDELAVSGAS